MRRLYLLLLVVTPAVMQCGYDWRREKTPGASSPPGETSPPPPRDNPPVVDEPPSSQEPPATFPGGLTDAQKVQWQCGQAIILGNASASRTDYLWWGILVHRRCGVSSELFEKIVSESTFVDSEDS